MDKNEIVILTTGGTIEKSYNERDGSLKNRNSVLKQRLLSRIRLPHTKITIEEIMAKDSLDMDSADRELIYEYAQKQFSKNVPVVILHGTDTMEQTAQLFYDRLAAPEVPIVFTGAMKPLGFLDSDALQNIVEALLAAQLVTPGIYVVFHNRVFPLPGVTKDKKLGTFIKTTASGELTNKG